MRHTPGPWEFRGNTVYTADDKAVARVQREQTHRQRVSLGTVLANGDLIAAAPEMLEALEDLMRQVNSGDGGHFISYLEIERVIAKARGEQL